MARIRTVKPAFFRHYELYLAERESGLPLRVAFAGLWTCADRKGRFDWQPQALKLDCLPYDEIDFSRVLDALTTRGFIRRYRVDGREYGAIPSFERHQVINNREQPSELPAPPEGPDESITSTRASRVDHATAHSLSPAQGEQEGKGREQEGNGKDASGTRPAPPPVRGGGLIVSPAEFDRQHGAHLLEFCDFVCLPRSVFHGFVTRAMNTGVSEADAEAQVRAWAHQVRLEWAGRIPGSDIFKFWRNEWEATHGDNAPARGGRDVTAGLRGI